MTILETEGKLLGVYGVKEKVLIWIRKPTVEYTSVIHDVVTD